MTQRRLDPISISSARKRSNETHQRRPTPEVPGWRRRIRVASVGTAAAAIAVLGSLTLTSHQEASAATLISTASAPLALASQSSLTTATTAGITTDIPDIGMSDGMPSPVPAAPMTANMPGMDMSGSTPSPAATAPMAANMPGMDMGGSSTTAPTDRPLGPVLGIFGGAAVLVLLAGAVIRRKDRAAGQAKKAARASSRAAR
jgi:hypothetical protein